MGSQSSGDLATALSQPRRHIVKACEGCRQQKIKCNGQSPCERCARLSLPCTVRTVARQRRQKIQQRRLREDDFDIIRTAMRPVRITDRVTGRSAVYGPTSTVALLHLLAAKANRDDFSISIEVSSSCLLATESDFLSMTPLKLNALAYQPYTISPTLGLSLAPPLCLTTIPNQLLQFFLNRYVGTAWSILPMQSPAQLGALFASACAAFSHNTPPPTLYPILLYQLAMGSLATAQEELSDMLVQESDMFLSAGSNLADTLDLQMNILMIIYIQYYREIGNFDRAYALLGPTASKIYAAGFHLEPRAPEVEKLIRILVGVEGFICISLGRPPILSPGIDVSHDNESTDSKYFTGLFAIVCPSLRAQNNPSTSFDELWHSIWTTQAKLKAYWEEYEALLRMEQTEPHRPWDTEDTMRLNVVLYEYTVLTNMKPLLLYMGHQNSALNRAASPASQASSSGGGMGMGMGMGTGMRQALTMTPSTSNPRQPPSRTTNENAKLVSASECILASAKKIISTISELRQGCSGAKDLPMHSFFLEAACTSLIAYGAWHNNVSAVWESIELGVRCMEELQYQRVAAQRLAAVRTAIDQAGLRRVETRLHLGSA
ncbi:Zn(II)2Cys6 transcription factor [Aspergillus mulundensis]|uniref:Zn(2)-C6 fungal-type domain-containing protein n=1 Tax=Aspergillus mulundensis TaxID=1810919 RepID=A0A3D8R419_9EURO|nr:Uncharacterized protein DSM5745_08486 [Aspergillus mulundensis]RDW68726.1 Uncharacterized protein DSM5745_08486 [Aspergillus mulundensis]